MPQSSITNPSVDPLEQERRIEAWIVSTIDDRGRVVTESDWLNSLERFSLAKQLVAAPRRASASNTSAAPSAPPSGWARFRLSRRKGVTVVTLTDQTLIKEADLQELTGDLLALIEAGHRRLVLDFQGVERLSSWASNAIAETVRQCSKANGGVVAVKVSGLKASIASIFAVSGVILDAATYPDVNAAVAGLWPELPELRPLPVSILSALMHAEDIRPTPPPPVGSVVEDSFAMNGVRLIVQDGPSEGRTVAVKTPRFVIGRGSSCHLRVVSSTVSRSHASIERRGSKVILRDLASTNGLLLNGKPLRAGEAEVHHGDRIQVGPMSFVLAVGPGRDDSNLRSIVPTSGTASRRIRALPTADLEVVDITSATEETMSFDGFGEEVELKYEIIEGTLVVTPMVNELDGDLVIDALRDALQSLFDRKLPRRVVISLAHVGHISSRAIGVLVAHHLRLDRVGGALRVCLAGPRVAVVLDQVRLAMLVDCHQTIDDAVIAAWPHAVETVE